MVAPRVGSRAWLVVAMLFLFMLINFADKAVLGLSAGPIMDELGLTHLQFGQVASSFFLPFSLAAVLVGFVVNRVSTKRVLLVMALVWSAAQLPMLLTVGLPMLMANRLLLGAGEGPAYPVAMHAAYKWFPNDRRPVPSSLIALGGAVGAGIAAPLVTHVIYAYSWHAAFGLLGALGLAWAIVWAVLGREGALDADTHEGAGAGDPIAAIDHVGYARLLTCRSVVGTMLLGFSAYWLLTLAVVWLPNYLNKGAGFAPQTASWIITLPSLSQILAVPSICAVSQALKRRGVSSRVSRGTVAAACVLVSGALAALLPRTDGLATILCVAIAFSIGNVVFSIGPVIVAEVTPRGQRGAMLGITNAVWTLAGLVAPTVMGWIVDLGTTPVEGFRLGFTVAGVLVVIGAIVGALLIDPAADLARFVLRDRATGDGARAALQF